MPFDTLPIGFQTPRDRPAGRLRINRANPMTRGLVGAWVFGNGMDSAVNLVNGDLGDNGTGAEWEPDGFRVPSSVGSSSAIHVGESDEFNFAAQAFGYLALITFAGFGTRQIVGIRDDALIHRMTLNNSNQIEMANNGTSLTGATNLATIGGHDGKMLVGCTVDDDDNAKIFLNGEVDASGAVTISTAFSGNRTTIGAMGTGAHYYVAGAIHYVLIFDREISEEENRALWNNWYQLFEPDIPLVGRLPVQQSGQAYTLTADAGAFAIAGFDAGLQPGFRLDAKHIDSVVIDPHNLLIRSAQLDNVTDWVNLSSPVRVADNWSSKYGDFEQIEDNGSAYEGIGQTVTATLDTSEKMTLSAYCKKEAIGRATRFPGLIVVYEGSTYEQNIVFWDTDTLESALTPAAGVNLTGGVIDIDSETMRVWMTFDTADPANDTLSVYLHPALGASAAWSISVAAQGSIDVGGVQLNRGELHGYTETDTSIIDIPVSSFYHHRFLTADAGAVAITGFDATLQKTGSYEITAEAGAFQITGLDADFALGFIITASPGQLDITGIDAEFQLGKIVVADVGAFVITGQSASLEYSGVPDLVADVELSQLIAQDINHSQGITRTVLKTGCLS